MNEIYLGGCLNRYIKFLELKCGAFNHNKCIIESDYFFLSLSPWIVSVNEASKKHQIPPVHHFVVRFPTQNPLDFA